MVILTGPATDEFVGPNRRQGFLDGLKTEVKAGDQLSIVPAIAGGAA